MRNRVEIPVLDCSEIKGSFENVKDSEALKTFAEKLGNAIENIGFVYFINHDTTPETVDNFHFKSREFFALPNEVKLKYRKKDAVENFHGYTSAGEERLGELEKVSTGKAPAELKECYDFWSLPAHDPDAFPGEVPGLKDSVDAFRDSLANLCKKLCRCFAIYLELEDKDYFLNEHRHIDDPTVLTQTVIRENYYFPIKSKSTKIEENEESVTLRLGEHCDWGSFTFLFQDEVGGLEAKMADGNWDPVKPIKDSIVLNAGLMLEYWSGGRLPATFHRVRAIGNRQYSTYRQSAAYFVQPDATARCVPLVPQKNNWNPSYPFEDTETHFEYFRNRVRESRADY